MKPTDKESAELHEEPAKPPVVRPATTNAPAPVPKTPEFVRGPTYTGPNRRAP